MKRHLTLLLALLSALDAFAQQKFPTKFTTNLVTQPQVAAALAHLDAHRDQQLKEWIRITETPAPSKLEEKRSAYFKAEFEKAGLSDVHLDEVGNCIGLRPGAGGGPTLVIGAHMDTVFPADTKLTVRREGEKLHAPGILDDSASCTALLAAIRARNTAGVKTKGDVIFLATVREEIGLQGMRHWLTKNKDRVNMIVALDGAIGNARYGALGIRWYKFVYSAEGAHTLNSRGKPNPALAVSQAIRDIYTIPLGDPGSEQAGIYNIGIIGGGTVVNAISPESFFTVDIRSNNPLVFHRLIGQITAFAEGAAKTNRVELKTEIMVDNPAGGTAKQLESRRAHPIVQTAIDIQTFLNVNKGKPVTAQASGATDANIGVEMGIPAIAVGTTHGDHTHTLEEWAEVDTAFLGAKQIVLLAASLAEVVE